MTRQRRAAAPLQSTRCVGLHVWGCVRGRGRVRSKGLCSTHSRTHALASVAARDERWVSSRPTAPTEETNKQTNKRNEQSLADEWGVGWVGHAGGPSAGVPVQVKEYACIDHTLGTKSNILRSFGKVRSCPHRHRGLPLPTSAKPTMASPLVTSAPQIARAPQVHLFQPNHAVSRAEALAGLWFIGGGAPQMLRTGRSVDLYIYIYIYV